MSQIQFTKYVSHTCANKRYSIVDGQVKNVADARFSSGVAKTITLKNFSDFPKHLKDADKFTTFGYGVSRFDSIKICTLASKRENQRTVITRTKPNFPYKSGPGIIMFDYDPSIYYKDGLVLKFEEWLDILISVFSLFDGAAYFVKHSMSACVVKSGKRNKAKGFHVYFKVPDASLIPYFGKLLAEHLKAAGYGYIALSSPGYEMPRTIIDICVFDGSRLDFVGAPTIGKGLEYIEPRTEFRNGHWLDLSKLKTLTPKQLDKRDEYYYKQREAIKPLKVVKQQEYDARKVSEYIGQGLSESEAQSRVLENRKRGWNILEVSTLIYLSDGTVIGLKDLIKQRSRLRFADPVEGISHGLTKAELRFDEFHKPYIWSYRFGGIRYEIEGYSFKKKNDIEVYKHDHDFLFSSLLPGAGKSYLIMSQIKLNKDQKYLVCLPSINLMDEYAIGLSATSPRTIKSMATKKRQNRILISDRIKSAVNDCARVILITHNALVDCIDHDLFKSLNNYNLVIDETFFSIAYKFSRFGMKKALSSGGIINRLCNAQHHELHDVLTIKDVDQYEAFCKEPGLESFDHSAEKKILKFIADDTKEVWMLNMKRSKKNVLFASIFNFKMLAYFKSRILLGACCKETALYHELSNVFNMKPLVIKGFEPRILNYGKINIWPLAESNYSMNQRDHYRYVSHDESKRYDAQQFTNKVMKVLEFKNSLRISNKDDYQTVDYEKDGHVFDRKQLSLSKEWVKGHVVTSNCAGLNKWKHMHNMAYVAAFNFRPHISTFLNYRLPEYNIWKENNALKAMQCIMRTSARDAESTEEVNVIVSDYRTALEVKEALNGEPNICFHPLYKLFKSEPLDSDEACNVVEFDKKSALKRGPKVKLTDEERKERKRISNAKTNAKRLL